MTDALVEKGNARREDVLIIFQDIQPGDSARGGVIAASAAAAEGSNGVRRTAEEAD
jgi:phenylpyruvate tautomerase PptA (4-oxalocrotonate tautomerase family)